MKLVIILAPLIKIGDQWQMSDFLFDHFTQVQVRNFVVHIGLAEALCFAFPIITSKSDWLVEGGSRHTSQFWNDP